MADQGEEHSLQNLLKALGEPGTYPHQPEQVTHIQTHISHVFMAPPFVYKLKKPVDFGFLDYSTLEKRRKYCHREVKLNRRLCEGIYLGVVGISYDGRTYSLVDEDDSSAVEYAVKMEELPAEYFLHRYIEEDRLKLQHLDRVADKLSVFYQQQQGNDLGEWGEIDTIKVNTDENFEQTEKFVGDTINSNTYGAIRYFTNQYFVSREALFKRRMAENYIVDGHGDLHLDHIHIMPEKVRIYDCIEFNDRFRYGDLAADLAFLAMDLDFNECWQEERYFIERMADKLNDNDLKTIIDFYKCYRAYVKGKVKSFQSAEDEVPEPEREEATQTAALYFDLSLRYALLGSQALAMICMGRVGAGKSTLAEHLSEKLNIPHYSSDHLRKSLANVSLTERPPKEKREELYSDSMSRRTYDMLKKKMEEELDKGQSVILDATFSSKELRSEFREWLEKVGNDYIFIEAQATDKVLAERLKEREQKRDVISDARLEDFDMLNKRYSKPDEIPDQHMVALHTGQALVQTIRQLYISLIDRHIG